MLIAGWRRSCCTLSGRTILVVVMEFWVGAAVLSFERVEAPLLPIDRLKTALQVFVRVVLPLRCVLLRLRREKQCTLRRSCEALSRFLLQFTACCNVCHWPQGGTLLTLSLADSQRRRLRELSVALRCIVSSVQMQRRMNDEIFHLHSLADTDRHTSRQQTGERCR